jgi:hypothetical protein
MAQGGGWQTHARLLAGLLGLALVFVIAAVAHDPAGSDETTDDDEPTSDAGASGRERESQPPAMPSPGPPDATPTPRFATPLPTPHPPSQRWQPAVRTSWQLQFSGRMDFTIDAEVFDVEVFDTTAETVAALHARGKRAICYLSVGSWEDWRSDAARYPESVKGRSNGWPGERWLDVRRLDILMPIIEARLDACREKGFDGADPDNVDGYQSDSGFPLTYEDQLRFNIAVANAARARGLSVGLKNDLPQIPDLLPYFDWTLNEQCFEYNECERLVPFVEAGKPVFNVEYRLRPDQFCARANALNFNSLHKRLELDAYRQPCR